VSPLWHATELGRSLMYGRPEEPLLTVVHVVYLVTLAVVGYVLARRNFTRRLAK
jgi:lipooligosaccharide transport system permease protein